MPLLREEVALAWVLACCCSVLAVENFLEQILHSNMLSFFSGTQLCLSKCLFKFAFLEKPAPHLSHWILLPIAVAFLGLMHFPRFVWVARQATFLYVFPQFWQMKLFWMFEHEFFFKCLLKRFACENVALHLLQTYLWLLEDADVPSLVISFCSLCSSIEGNWFKSQSRSLAKKTSSLSIFSAIFLSLTVDSTIYVDKYSVVRGDTGRFYSI